MVCWPGSVDTWLSFVGAGSVSGGIMVWWSASVDTGCHLS